MRVQMIHDFLARKDRNREADHRTETLARPFPAFVEWFINWQQSCYTFPARRVSARLNSRYVPVATASLTPRLATHQPTSRASGTTRVRTPGGGKQLNLGNQSQQAVQIEDEVPVRVTTRCAQDVIELSSRLTVPEAHRLRVGIVGMGYVGATCAAGLGQLGHTIVGVDISPHKLELLGSGRSPVLEPGLEGLLGGILESGRLSASPDLADAVLETDLTLICVGTPSRPNGSLDLAYVLTVTEQIGALLARKDAYHCVCVRSTVTPGTVREQVVPLLERASGKQAGRDFGVCMNPEFLREGTALRDFFEPELTIIGEYTETCGDRVAQLYSSLSGEVMRRSIEEAEMIKYVNNAWHANKVAFANEIGVISKAVGVDGRSIMEVVCADRRLNVSPAYMRPGFAFGGSCLPKDLRALTYNGQKLDLELPLLRSILPSNERHIDRALALAAVRDSREVALLGLTFKPGTDDLRESPMVELAERLLGKGYRLRIYDPNVVESRIVGSNRAFVEAHLPHLAELLHTDLNACVEGVGAVVVGNAYPEAIPVLGGLAAGIRVVDLCGQASVIDSDAEVIGICW